MAAKTSLDSFDRKILDCLQDDADMPLAEIAAKVELSDVTSMFAMEEIKSTTRLPLSYLP